MDFIRSTSEKINLWPVGTLFPRFFSRSALNQHWSGKKRGKKVPNWSEVHFFRSTSYEIHILTDLYPWNYQSWYLSGPIYFIHFIMRRPTYIIFSLKSVNKSMIWDTLYIVHLFIHDLLLNDGNGYYESSYAKKKVCWVGIQNMSIYILRPYIT